MMSPTPSTKVICAVALLLLVALAVSYLSPFCEEHLHDHSHEQCHHLCGPSCSHTAMVPGPVFLFRSIAHYGDIAERHDSAYARPIFSIFRPPEA